MKVFPDMGALQEQITLMVKTLNPKLVKSITDYKLYLNTFFEYEMV